MATYEYSGYKADGAKCKGKINSNSPKQALRDLANQGIFADRVARIRAKGKLPVALRSSLYRELGALIGAGIALDRALALLQESDNNDVGDVLSLVTEKIHEGRSLAESLGELFTDMHGFETAALASAERTGTLPDMLGRVAEFLDAREEIRDKIRAALIYPSFVLGLGLIIVVVMLGFVVPRTTAMLASTGMTLPRASVLIVAGAKIGATVLGIAAALLGIGFAFAKNRARTHHDFAVRLDRLLLFLPGMTAARGLAGMRFASILSVLTGSGMPIVDALPIAGSGMGNAWLADHVRRQTNDVRNGRNLSHAIAEIPFIGRELGEWVKVGEAGGCVTAMLDVAAGRFGRQWDRTLTRRLAMLEPLMLCAVGLFVLLVALAMILPIVSMTKNIGLG